MPEPDVENCREPGIRAAGGPRAHAEPRRVVLFIAAQGTVPECLVWSLEREYPWVTVRQVETIEEACASFGHMVALILVDPALLRSAEEASAELARQHPTALTALLELDSHNPSYSLAEIFGSRLVRGVLPMNLKLDVWLSVIGLMLRGGEYFPTGMFHLHARRMSDGHNSGIRPGGLNGTSERLADLTSREYQILEMVSRGMQNKTIAAEFRLSEHTVKIHLHNIISKLGAHNRTEAAARFRDHQDRMAFAGRDIR
ncbi:DNA-binding NarL/FixJ family response regulator [Mesorhizobium sp. J18]|uniref:helix-turn-helix transcriptional regulator n=1 Tax=Mesorhizobium sp. J18 TaxID=935263 RepID=UPI00119BA0F3|nr:response regulator transcription factor [Mesorhizobium sp. J18]TWG96703.1 DNA-binding NarL/FixJ family response regulator [Mesorhizobium sp. J18]